MATLEIHHGRNRVERVSISRDHPILFGSSPKCDIVIDGPGVVPYHGRLRWKSSGYYKVDASTDGEFVELNGRKVWTAKVPPEAAAQDTIGLVSAAFVRGGRGDEISPRTTHVVTVVAAFPDAGSIPAASTMIC